MLYDFEVLQTFEEIPRASFHKLESIIVIVKKSFSIGS